MPKRDDLKRIDLPYSRSSGGQRVLGGSTTIVTNPPGGSTGGLTELPVHDLDGDKHAGTLSWSKVNKTGSSLADLETKAYTALTGRTHDLLGADHSVTGDQYDIVGLTTTNTIGLLTPSEDGTAANKILKTNASGTLGDLNVTGLYSSGSATVEGLAVWSDLDGGVSSITLTDEGGGAYAAIEYDNTNRQLDFVLTGQDFLRFDYNGGSLIGYIYQDFQTDNVLESVGFSSGDNEAKIDFDTGVANFHTVYTNNLIAETFVAGVKLAQVGNITVGHSAALLSRDWTIPSKGSGSTMYIKNLPGVGDYQAFKQYDRLLIQFINIDSSPFVFGKAYIRITSTITSSGDEQSFTAEYMDVTANVEWPSPRPTIYAETTVVSLTALSSISDTESTGGYWEASTLQSDSAGGPFDQVVTMLSEESGGNYTLTLTPVLRSGYLGNLGKIGGGSFAAGDIGFWFDDPNSTAAAHFSSDGSAMRNVSLRFYDGSDYWLDINETDGINILVEDGNTFNYERGFTMRGTDGSDYGGLLGYEYTGGTPPWRYMRLAQEPRTSYNAAINIESIVPTTSLTSYISISARDDANTVPATILARTQSGSSEIWLTADDVEVRDGGTFTVTSPGTSPSGSYITASSPAASIGLIMYGSSTGMGEWGISVDKTSGDLLFTDRTDSNYATLTLDSGGKEVRMISGQHHFGNQESTITGALLVSANGETLTGNADSADDYTDPTGGQIIIEEGDDASAEGAMMSLCTFGYSRMSFIGFNAYVDNVSGSPMSNASGNMRFRGAQSTATTAGAFTYYGNGQFFGWYSTSGSKTDDAQITDWGLKMRLNWDGSLQPTIVGESWQSVTFASSNWDHYNTIVGGGTTAWGAVKVKKFGDMVFLKGAIGSKNNSSSWSQHMLTVPSGYEPPKNVHFTAWGYMSGTAKAVSVYMANDGKMYLRYETTGTEDLISLDGLQYSLVD